MLANTVRANTKVLEDLFLVRRLGPWHVNRGSRQVKSPTVYVVDSGLLTCLMGADERRLASDGAIMSAALESFVAMELLR